MEAITVKEREYLRDLAKKQQEYAEEERNLQAIKLWKQHNSFCGSRPPVVIEEIGFWEQIRPRFYCSSEMGQFMENKLLQATVPISLIGDDRIIEDYFSIDAPISSDTYGIVMERKKAGGVENVGYRDVYAIEDLETDLDGLQASKFYFDEEKMKRQIDICSDILDGILPVRVENRTLDWSGIAERMIHLMSMENLCIAMYDCPNKVHEFVKFVTDDLLNFAKWQEEQGILTPNWNLQRCCGVSCGITDELPQGKRKNTELEKGRTDIRLKDLWINTNAQETVVISKDMYIEFFLSHYQRLTQEFGLVYYGCCEPVHTVFENGLDQIENLRKLSISPWCNEEMIAEQLQGKKIIYSRKISPNYLGVGHNLDEQAFRKHIRKTLDTAKGLEIEILSRDVYMLDGNIKKLARATEIIREEIER